ncbi:MAG: transposase [Halieaceae bacterium]|jgi:transposase|nr:transposase [Halieaceae bacterium]
MKEVLMPRLNEAKRNELEAFWRAHLEGWAASELNQREYCELHGLPLKRFGNWRAKLRQVESGRAEKLLYRRGGGAKPVLEHRLDHVESPYIPSGRSGEICRRRDFAMADKRRMVEEAARPGATVSGVARKYGIARRLLFQWKKDLAIGPQPAPVLAEVRLGDMEPDQCAMPSPATAAPVVVERQAPGIEVELKGGRRVRFDRETDPGTIRALVEMLEGVG